MARYRPVHVKIWSDPHFEEYSKNQKLIFLYLITNEHTTESGIYPITLKTISQRTDIPTAEVEKAFSSFKNISYEMETGCVFIHNFLRYNGGGRPDLLKLSVQQDAKTTKTSLWRMFDTLYPNYKITPPQTPPSSITSSISSSISIEPLDNGLPTVCQPLKQSNKNNNLQQKRTEAEKPTKVQYREFVFLSAVEFDRLVREFGKTKTEKAIEILDNYIGAMPQKRNKYTDHNRVIRLWVMKRVEEEVSDGGPWSHLPRK